MSTSRRQGGRQEIEMALLQEANQDNIKQPSSTKIKTKATVCLSHHQKRTMTDLHGRDGAQVQVVHMLDEMP